MHEILSNALIGILVPAITAAAVLILLRKGSGPSSSRGIEIPLALGLGYAAGHVAVNGLPPWRFDVELKHGLFWLTLAATFLGWIEARRGVALWIGRLLLAAATPLYLLDFMREHHWGPGEGWIWTASLALVLGLAMVAVDGLMRRQPGGLGLIGFALASALAGGAIALSGSATLGQLTGAWAAALAAGALACGRSPLQLGPGATPLLVLILAGLLFGGRFASELTTTGALLLALAPLAPWLLESGPVRRMGRVVGWRRLALACLCIVLLGGGALVYEWTQVPEDPYANYMQQK